MESILGLIKDTGAVPPDHLTEPVETTPFFQIGPEGFLMLPPSGGRIHYAPGVGLSVAPPTDRPEGDFDPFIRTSAFAAAAWFAGTVPLRANAVRLKNGKLLLLASERDDVHESMALALADVYGLAVSEFPVVVDPEDPTQVATNGGPMTIRRMSKDAAEPPVRAGANRLQLDRPVIDGGVVHACAGLVCVADHRTAPPGGLKELSLIHAVTEVKKHIFMPLAGTAIWGNDTMNAAYVVLGNRLPVHLFNAPAGGPPMEEMAVELMQALDALGEV